MGDNRKYIRVSLGKPKIRGHLEEPGVDEDNIKMNCSKIITNKMTLMDFPLFQG